MTIYELIKKDHRAVGKLLKEGLKNLPKNPEKALKIFNTIKSELIPHAKAEEEVFYEPLVNATKDPKGQAYASEGKAEHHVIALIVKELSDLNCHSLDWAAKFKVLSEVIEHHVEEEESDIFSKAKKHYSTKEAKDLALAMAKKKLEYKNKVDDILLKE